MPKSVTLAKKLMFSFFNKKPKCVRLDDKVFIKRQEADVALVVDLNNFKLEGKTVVVLYFFEDTLKRLQSLQPSPECQFYSADKVIRDLSIRSGLKSKSNLVLVFAEHHPSATRENAVLAEIENMYESEKPTLGFYMALEEPMMKPFGVDRIISLMKQMGMKEGEAITNSMVTKSIANMQEKIAKRCTTDLIAHSQEEWMKLNFSNG